MVSPFGASQELVELPDVGFAICLADCFALQEAKPKEPEVKDTEEKKLENEKPKLPLSWDNVQEADCGWAERHVKHVLFKCSPHPQRIGVRCEVLDELRPYLKSDGGDCKISSIDGGVVSLELIGACSSCSASSVTMKMGIETLGSDWTFKPLQVCDRAWMAKEDAERAHSGHFRSSGSDS